MRRAPAPAKINLALAVGPLREDGKHELVTIYQRVDLADRVSLDPADRDRWAEVGRTAHVYTWAEVDRPSARVRVEGFPEDTLVKRALEAVAAAAGVEPDWRARIDKRIPVAAGLGGGSSDAATALRLANEALAEPLSREQLDELARALGADVPFFLEPGPQLGSGDGSALEPLDLPQDYFVILALPHGAQKESTAAVYARFDGADGFDERAARIRAVAARARRPRDLADLPPNDLASSPLAARLLDLGAFRADVSGAGPTVYGLFNHRAPAEAAERALRAENRCWITVPAWYG